MFSLMSAKAIVVLIAVIGFGGFSTFQFVKIQRAEAARATAILEKEEAIVARDKAISSAEQNARTIESLQAEKLAATAALAALELKRKKDVITINKLGDIIAGQNNNPANQTTLSPVLDDVVRQIQIDRAFREERQ